MLRSRTQSTRLNLEALESRELLANNVTATLTGRVLRIEGTPNADQIRIVQSGQQISVEGISILDNGTSRPSITATALDRIFVDALGGDDHLWIGNGNQTLTRSLEVLGSAGNDFLHSRGTTFAAGLDNGIRKLLQSKDTVYSVGQDGSLSSNGKKLTFGGFSLSTAEISIGDTGLTVNGEADLPLVKKVRFEGTIDDAGNYFLETDVGASIELLGGMVVIDKISVKLVPKGAEIKAHVDVAKIGFADLIGTLTTDGNYSLKGKGGVKLGPITADGIDFALGTTDVGFMVPVPSIGNVKVKGSVRPDGQWYIEGTYPQTVVVGGIPLQNITVGVGADRFTVGADTGIENILQANVTGTMFYDGRFTLRGTARAITLGSFSLGNGIIVFSNDPATTGLPDRTIRLTVDANVGITGGPSVRLNGFVDGKGNYELAGSDALRVAGLTLQETQFKLKKGEGFTFKAKWSYYVFSADVTGTIQSSGKIHFKGTAKTANVSGINLDQLRGVVDLDPTTGVYQIDFSSTKNVGIATVDFRGTARRDAQGIWQTPTLTGEAAVKGALANILSGSARFELKISGGLTFAGSLKLPANLGRLSVNGKVYPDGTVSIGNTRVGTTRITAAEAAQILKGEGASIGQIVGTLVAVYKTSINDAARILNDLKYGLSAMARALLDVKNDPVAVFNAIANGAGRGGADGLTALVGADLLKNNSYEAAKFLLNQVKVSLTYTAKAIHGWVSGDKAVNTFWAIASGAGRGGADGLKALVGADLLKNNSYEAAKFLLNRADASLSYTAKAIHGWVNGDKVVNTFWAIASGAGRGGADGLTALVGADLLKNSSSEAAKFLLNQVKASLGYTAKAIHGWVRGDKVVNAFFAIANGAGRGGADGLTALVSADLLQNSSHEAAKFLLNRAGVSLGYAAKAIHGWVSGDKVVNAFFAIANGAGRGGADGLTALVSADLLKNNSYEAAKFLLNQANAGLSYTARAIHDWVSGDKRVNTFWAIASGANRSYADAVRGLIGADLLGNRYNEVSGFLIARLGTFEALRVLRELF